MLKSVSSITNAIGALNFAGTWNASTNTPTLTSSVGTKGDYYVVGVSGSTTLNGISNWGVGDLATFNGSVWQRVEGGADLNGVNLSVSGTSTLSALTASTALALNASKEIVSVTNTGTGDNVLATAPTLVGNVTLSTGNLVIGTSGKGIDFAAAGGNVLTQYDEYTAPSAACTGAITTAAVWKATKVGNVVTLTLPTTTGTASASAFFQYGELLPTAFRPTATIAFVSCPIKDNDTNVSTPGMIFVLTTGVIRVYKDATAASNFTASVNAGIGQSVATAVSWTI